MKSLFLFLMQGFLAASRAILEDFHLRGMGLLVAGGDVVFVAALAAFENRLITFSSHSSLTSFVSAAMIPQEKT